MCGIAGFIGERTQHPRDALARMSGALTHRGPDADGMQFVDFDGDRSQLALAHRRLAIIDLDPASNQPMQTEDRRFTIIFNGEIYNYIELRQELGALGHRFRTASDTEVLLRAFAEWRLSMFDRLSGMFAFALWDNERSELVLARDPFGKKPLYLMEEGGRLGFASEISALQALSERAPDIDLRSVEEYLLWRYVPGPATLFKNIRKLNPGSYAVWSGGRLAETRYYTPPDRTDVRETFGRGEAEGRFLELFERGVEIRMRSDAPFGAFLSGGLDSSAIVAMMVRHSDRPVRTFSVGFSEQRYSELPYARSVAEHFRTQHTEIAIGAGDLMGHLNQMVRHRGAPVSQSTDIPIYLMSRRASEDVKMVLTGEGADEILGGYPKHRAEAYAGIYRSLVPDFVHEKIVTPVLQRLPAASAKIRTFVRSAGERDFAARMIYWFGAMSHRERDRLTGRRAPGAGERNLFPFSSSPDESHLRRALFFDQTSWLPDNLLERGDRMMMAGSIEGRMPFLDRDLVAFASKLPDRYKLGPRQGKRILRDVMADVLPRAILKRPKVGFHVPVADWFRGSMRGYVQEHLCSSSSVIRTYLDAAELDRIVAEHGNGAVNHEKLIWALLNLEIFHREFQVGAP